MAFMPRPFWRWLHYKSSSNEEMFTPFTHIFMHGFL